MMREGRTGRWVWTLALTAGFGLGGEALAGHCGGGLVTVGGPAAAIASPPQGFYGGYNLAAQTRYQASVQSAQSPARADGGVILTAYQEPGGQPAATTPAALNSTSQPPATTPATAANRYMQPIPMGAINYNNGYHYLSPAAVLSPAPEGPTSGHGRRWIRFYFPPGMTYFHDQGYGY
ncbi:MAG TPA: hypothetical protein VFT74_11325 [Isosphaeraceae bacterium]|nr:hypothetical protein [Isosphaeraceae bacterium]